MAIDRMICTGCKSEFDPALEVCPHCGARVNESLQNRERPLLAEIQRKLVGQQDASSEVPAPLVYLSPEDEGRRFPLLTRAQLTLAAAGVCLLILLLLIGYLLWRQQKRESLVGGPPAAVTAVPVASPEPSLNASPSPTAPDDAAILVAVKAAVTNYNPTGFSRYSTEVKDGIVTVNGEAETQPEKDGVENVIRPVSGVRAIVNNLIVRLAPVMVPYRSNEAEAKRLDEAFRKAPEGQRSSRSANAEPQVKADPLEADREAERKRREALAAKIRDEEDRARRAAEEKLQKEAAEYEKRLEEQRRFDGERRARAEQARLEASVLRSGTIAWSGLVDGVAEIIISGASASVRNLSGESPREVKSSFSAAVPRAPIAVKLLSTSGRGTVTVTQEPAATNAYTTIVRIDDLTKGGQQRYEFTLRWSIR